jgi:hypothetical protein
MIHELGVELAAYLGSKGCPFVDFVVDGPELRPTTTFARERIVIEHDMQGGDTFTPRTVANREPGRIRLNRVIGVKLTIYAQCPNKGAAYWEHVRRAEHVLDMVLAGLDIIKVKRKNHLVWRGGKFVFPEDFKPETAGGAVYELAFTFDRGVAVKNWDGTAEGTATITSVYPVSSSGVIIQNTDNVSGSTEDGGPQTEEIG